MRRALFSIMLIGIVAIGATAGSLAYFHDTESSEGNTFTAGTLDLKVDWVEHYNGEIIEERAMSNLADGEGETDPIFNLEDVKPGDSGEATISLHSYTNDAWACMEIVPTSFSEKGINEPEGLVDNTEGLWDGELAQNLNIQIWQENDGNNEFDESSERILFSGKANEMPLRYSLDQNLDLSDGIQPLIGCENYYIGISWWISTEVGNEIQSDELSFDIIFNAYQRRHQDDNPCIPEIERYPGTGTAYIGYEDWYNGDFDYNDFGMRFRVKEEYNKDNNLIGLEMHFNAIIYDSGADHHIHIMRPLVGDYTYTVDRIGTSAIGPETPEGVYRGSEDLDVLLFDTAKYSWPEKNMTENVNITVRLDRPDLNPKDTLTPPRSFTADNGDTFYDVAGIMSNYDPWEDPYTGIPAGSEFHIENTQEIESTSNQKNTDEIIPVDTKLPFILVVPDPYWIPPYEDTTITGPYGYFDNFYIYGTPENWYENQYITENSVGPGGLSW